MVGIRLAREEWLKKQRSRRASVSRPLKGFNFFRADLESRLE
jgi:hypothetical protein